MKTSILLIAFVCVLNYSYGQSSNKYQFGLYGNVGLPTGEFRDAVNNSLSGTGWGAGMNFLINPKKGGVYSPVFLGIEGNYMNLGTDKIPASAFLPQLKTTFNYYNIGPVIRVFLMEKEEGFIPFLDGFIGMKALNTNTQVDNSLLDTILDQEALESLLSTNYEGLGYGVGLGFYNRKFNDRAETGHGSFYLRLMYQYGDRINYVMRGSVKVDKGGVITYQTDKTQTGILSLQLGFLIY
jgi:hypothetical protein